MFVATSGCTWQQLSSASFGPSGATAHRRFAAWTKARVWAKLHRLVLDELGSRGEFGWSRCAIDSVNMRALKKGGRGRGLSTGQVRFEDPFDHTVDRSARARRDLEGEPARQPGLGPAGEGHTADPLSPRPTTAQAGQAPRRQGIRLRALTVMVTGARDHPPHRP